MKFIYIFLIMNKLKEILMLKKLLFFLYVFHFSGCIYLEADDTYWDVNLVRSYVHNSDLQRRWALAFLVSNLQAQW
jgi:hypothetical protein